jgi:biopolymer transport protein ExbD
MSAGGGGGEGDVELNLAPIVDCFTVLIAYLLVSMSFISLSIFDAGLTASGPPPEAEVQPAVPPDVPLNFSVELSATNRLEMKLTGGKQNINQVIDLEAVKNEVDLDGMKNKIGELLTSFPDLKEANISADPTVRYKSIVKIIEAVKTKLPKVFLASS